MSVCVRVVCVRVRMYGYVSWNVRVCMYMCSVRVSVCVSFEFFFFSLGEKGYSKKEILFGGFQSINNNFLLRFAFFFKTSLHSSGAAMPTELPVPCPPSPMALSRAMPLPSSCACIRAQCMPASSPLSQHSSRLVVTALRAACTQSPNHIGQHTIHMFHRPLAKRNTSKQYSSTVSQGAEVQL